MTRNYEAEIQNNLAGFNPTAEKIILVNEETNKYDFKINVIIKDKDKEQDIYNLQLNTELPGDFFRDFLLIDSNLFIAVENYVYFFNLENKDWSQYKIEGFFDKFHRTETCILVATNTHMACFTYTGDKIWISDKLSIEKIQIKKLSETHIIGNGSLNDGKGNVEFTLSLLDGKSIYSKTNKKRRNFFTFLFA